MHSRVRRVEFAHVESERLVTYPNHGNETGSTDDVVCKERTEPVVCKRAHS